MSITKRQEDWFATAPGRAMNLDGVYGLQCVDVPNDYAERLFGDWQRTMGRGDAKDKYNIAPSEYWQKIRNNSADPNLIPARGDVIVWGAMPGNPAGHIAVVASASVNNVTVIEQDGFLQVPARTKTYSYIVNGTVAYGWIRPRTDKIIRAAHGGAEDMTIGEYAADILDVIEDNPHYSENKKQAFKGHVDWLVANPSWEKRRQWTKGIMRNNQVLNATLMKNHLEADEAQSLACDKLENTNQILTAQLESQDHIVDTLTKENVSQAGVIKNQTGSLATLRTDLNEATATIATLKDAAKASEPVAALSAWELIAAGINKLFGREVVKS